MATHDWTGTPTPPPLSLHKAVQRHPHPLFNATEMYRSRHTYVRSSGPSGIYGGKPNLPLHAPPLPRASLCRMSPHFFHPRPSKLGQGQNVCNRRACRAWMGALNPFRNTHQERNYFSYLGDCATVPPMRMAQSSRQANTSSGQRRCEFY